MGSVRVKTRKRCRLASLQVRHPVPDGVIRDCAIAETFCGKDVRCGRPPVPQQPGRACLTYDEVEWPLLLAFLIQLNVLPQSTF